MFMLTELRHLRGLRKHQPRFSIFIKTSIRQFEGIALALNLLRSFRAKFCKSLFLGSDRSGERPLTATYHYSGERPLCASVLDDAACHGPEALSMAHQGNRNGRCHNRGNRDDDVKARHKVPFRQSAYAMVGSIARNT